MKPLTPSERGKIGADIRWVNGPKRNKCPHCGALTPLYLPQQKYCSMECYFAHITPEPARVFWTKVINNGPNRCWGWRAASHKGRYQTIRLNGKTERASRFSWLIHNGPIPAKMFVCHTCDNPPCTNPSHLFLGTALDNARDRSVKGRSCRGENSRFSVLPEKEVKKIRAMPGIYQEIADRFGVCRGTIKKIKGRKTWKHVR